MENKIKHKVIICSERQDEARLNKLLDEGWLVKSITKVNFVTTEYLLEKIEEVK